MLKIMVGQRDIIHVVKSDTQENKEKAEIEMCFYGEAPNHRFPISKQDKGVHICSHLTATGNAVREL